MEVDLQAAIRRDPAQGLDRGRSVRRRALEMRDAADDVDTHVEGALQSVGSAGRAEVSVLRKRDELEVDIGFDLLAHVEQRLDRKEAGIADVDVAADREQALGDREVAIAQGALDKRPRG